MPWYIEALLFAIFVPMLALSIFLLGKSIRGLVSAQRRYRTAVALVGAIKRNEARLDLAQARGDSVEIAKLTRKLDNLSDGRMDRLYSRRHREERVKAERKKV